MSDQNDVQAVPLMSSPAALKETSPRPLSPMSNQEYKFVHQRIPPRKGPTRFFLPVILLTFEVIFIVLFGVFGSYYTGDDQKTNHFTMFTDLHAIALLGFGFLMTFTKRYGYGSIGFNLLLVAFVIQWAILLRGWLECNPENNGQFKIGLVSLVNADLTAVAILISFGALLGKATLSQLVSMAIVEAVVQIFNEYLNKNVILAYDVGRSVYVHLFGALFGVACAKGLHWNGVKSSKQASVYHSDMFALIGTLFLWVYYPSFNSILVDDTIKDAQMKAVVNTYAAIAASCVVSFGVSSLAGKGKLNVLHIQHATIAGGIAIGSVADLDIQIYVALIAGATAGLTTTIGYQSLSPFLRNKLKIHDTCSVLSLHGITGLIASLLGAIFAAVANYEETTLYKYYPARAPRTSVINVTNGIGFKATNGLERTSGEQAGYQILALVITVGLAVVFGLATGFILRLPVFEKLSEEVEMFDDEAQWVTPDDYALKLTFANNNNLTTTEQDGQDSKV